MGLLNKNCVILVVLAAIALWAIPIGMLVDGVLISLWIAFKRRGNAKSKKNTAGESAIADAVNALTRAVSGEKPIQWSKPTSSSESTAKVSNTNAQATTGDEYSQAVKELLAD
jgi:hypothetical protein